ncbi:LEA_2 domain-containing protein [Cephalotus follicularis]|uniref:LEA_2 domain-containing protein n=1 Tax=Cephalotus follicularis TaxID=3775 RepID=A0A1Q3ANX9_CEPFO|nr:LEA_2 domain-containing protein [Cephalotus follicularis]
MSAKDCEHHGQTRRKIFRRIFAGILIFLLVILITILIVWAILRPSKPNFILQDATLYALNLSSPNTLTSTFQVTFSSRNPNDNIGIYYDKLNVYANYRNQQITYRTAIPPTYQGHNEVNIWSPLIYGVSVPVAPYNAVALGQDEGSGAILLTIKMDGRVRWKVGTFTTGGYHIFVTCPAFIQFGNGASGNGNGIVVGENVVKYQLLVSCSVSV